MKHITFKDRSYAVDNWVKYVTQDSTGLVSVHELQPEMTYDSGGMACYRSYGLTEELSWPSCICVEVE